MDRTILQQGMFLNPEDIFSTSNFYSNPYESCLLIINFLFAEIYIYIPKTASSVF